MNTCIYVNLQKPKNVDAFGHVCAAVGNYDGQEPRIITDVVLTRKCGGFGQRKGRELGHNGFLVFASVEFEKC